MKTTFNIVLFFFALSTPAIAACPDQHVAAAEADIRAAQVRLARPATTRAQAHLLISLITVAIERRDLALAACYRDSDGKLDLDDPWTPFSEEAEELGRKPLPDELEDDDYHPRRWGPGLLDPEDVPATKAPLPVDPEDAPATKEPTLLLIPADALLALP